MKQGRNKSKSKGRGAKGGVGAKGSVPAPSREPPLKEGERQGMRKGAALETEVNLEADEFR